MDLFYASVQQNADCGSPVPRVAFHSAKANNFHFKEGKTPINYITRKQYYTFSEVTYHLKWETRECTFFQRKSVTKRSMEE